jgi:hypothetical protein
MTVVERLQRGDGAGCVPLAVLVAAKEPGQPRQPALRRAYSRRVAYQLEQLHRRTPRLPCLTELIGQIALVGERRQQSCAVLIRRIVDAQRQSVLFGCLPVGAEARGAGGGTRCELEDGFGVAAAGGVARQPAVVAYAERSKRPQRCCVQHIARHRREGLLDGQSRELVPKRPAFAAELDSCPEPTRSRRAPRLRGGDGSMSDLDPPRHRRRGGRSAGGGTACDVAGQQAGAAARQQSHPLLR